MNQQRQPKRIGEKGGSVRLARERAEAALPLAAPSPASRPGPSPNRSRPQLPAGFSGVRDQQGQIGVAISRPTQVPQWPLAGGGLGPQSQYQPPAGRGVAPQRPPRPRNVPSMLDASRLQDHTPSFQYTPSKASQDKPEPGDYYEDDGFSSPDISSPAVESSRPSTISSVGSIPDFPVPAIPQISGPRRSGNLGPPPLSRRGASAYFSQQSFVSPIPEESPRTTLVPSHLSYASSAAIPQQWPRSPDSPGSNFDDFEYYDELERGIGGQNAEEGRVSRGSTAGDDSDDRGLIRNASVGKRAKPSMITTKSFDKGEDSRATGAPKPLQLQKSKVDGAGGPIGVAMTASPVNTAEQRQNFWPTTGSNPSIVPTASERTAWPMIGNPGSPLASGTGLIDATPSTSADSVPTLSNPTGIRVKRSSTADPNMNPILGAYNAASALGPGSTQNRTSSVGGFSRWSAVRRPPPRLDIDAVREAEARGSLTSLPELIRRATRLAAMMDRGKRPASRNNLNDFRSDIDLSSRDKELSPVNRGSSFSGMIGAFPPPGSTPREGTPRPISTWPAGFDAADKETDNQKTNPRKASRRCCGMPCWALFLLLLIILLIVAAAVVVPLYFLVIKKNMEEAAAPTPLQRCQQDTAQICENGGMASLSSGSCSCICINGFTGSTCTTFDGGACSTITLQDTSVQVTNATLGDAIPRLISSAQSNFSVPLSETILLARFNTADLSCVSQNALVTFGGQSTRIGAANAVIQPIAGTETTKKNKLRRRQSQTTSTSAAAGTPTTESTTTSSSPGSTPSPETKPTAPIDLAALFNVTQEVLDFSRVAVLYILQEETFTDAAAAQASLQRSFGLQSFTNGAARNVSLGNGNSIDLLSFRIDLTGELGIVGGRTGVGVSQKRAVLGLGLDW